ncbi:MAG: class I SAM-dependent methyltransferase [Candidatus Omnitrophota bacterium]
MKIRTFIKRVIDKTIRKRPCCPDLSVLEHLRSKGQSYLSNAAVLEMDLLPKLGLNNEWLHQIPEELHPFCGQGVYAWQYPNQFSKYLVKLSEFKIESYLEIGIHHGGTFIITLEYLKKFHPLQYAVGVDIEPCPVLLEYGPANPNVNFMLADSQSRLFKEFIKTHSAFDLVFIDGDHDEDVCQRDFDNIKDKANIFILHDIISESVSGPGKVWRRIKSKYSRDYHFFEFTEQYESVKKRTGKSYLGAGMAVKRSFMEKQAAR